ncbi:MAG: methyltransferase domain-containing protein, partial [Chloroflexota bacterium]
MKDAPPPAYGHLVAAFNRLAPRYDAGDGPGGNEIMRWMRRENLALLQAAFPPGSRLLEIGCGSGEEALHLARAGYTIVATDLSPAMAAQTAARARAGGLAERVTALVVPAAHLAALHPPAPFDGAYASFGSLNCEPDLPCLAAALAGLLRPGAAFVCSVMGRWCPFELLWFLLHGQPRPAFRRLRPGWQLAPLVEGVTVPVRYFSAQDIAAVFAPTFTLERTLALPLLLPPPYLAGLYRRYQALFAYLEKWEKR